MKRYHHTMLKKDDSTADYVIYDLFQRPVPMERIEVQWDGTTASFPHLESWEGVELAEIPESYW